MKFKNDAIVFCVFCVIFIAVSIGMSLIIGSPILDEQWFWNRIDNNFSNSPNYDTFYGTPLRKAITDLTWLLLIVTIIESKIKPIRKMRFFVYSSLATLIIVPLTVSFFKTANFTIILLPMIILAIKSTYQNKKPSFIDAFFAIMIGNFGIALCLGILFTLSIGLYSFAYLTLNTTVGLSFIWLLCLFYNFLSPKEKEGEPEAT
jgi:hypothetical protein